MRKSLPLPLGFLWAATFVLWIACGALLLARTLDRDLNHDEHQFVAPATLLLRDCLLPYRDYPLFHLPNIVSPTQPRPS